MLKINLVWLTEVKLEIEPTPSTLLKLVSKAVSLLCNLITKRALIVLLAGNYLDLLYCFCGPISI